MSLERSGRASVGRGEHSPGAKRQGVVDMAGQYMTLGEACAALRLSGFCLRFSG